MKLWLTGIAAALLLLAGGCGKPRDVSELLNGAMREAAAGNLEEATRLAEKAADQAPDRLDALLLQAILLEKQGQFEAALQAAVRAAEEHPDDFVAQYTLGRLYAADRNHAHEALVALGKAANLRPGDRNTLILLCNVHMTLDPAQAGKYLLSLARDRALFNSAPYQNQLGLSQLRNRNYQAAGQAFLRACRQAPDEATYLLNLATCMDRYLGKSRVAVPLYQRYLDLAPATPESADTRRTVSARLRTIRDR